MKQENNSIRAALHEIILKDKGVMRPILSRRTLILISFTAMILPSSALLITEIWRNEKLAGYPVAQILEGMLIAMILSAGIAALYLMLRTAKKTMRTYIDVSDETLLAIADNTDIPAAIKAEIADIAGRGVSATEILNIVEEYENAQNPPSKPGLEAILKFSKDTYA